MKVIISLLLTLSLIGCSKSNKQIAGVYVKSPSVHTIDSLFLTLDTVQSQSLFNKYEFKMIQKFYNKKSSKLLFVNESNWYIHNHYIRIDKFYVDFDSETDLDTIKPHILKDYLMGASLPLSFWSSTIILNEDYDTYYKKVR